MLKWKRDDFSVLYLNEAMGLIYVDELMKKIRANNDQKLFEIDAEDDEDSF